MVRLLLALNCTSSPLLNFSEITCSSLSDRADIFCTVRSFLKCRLRLMRPIAKFLSLQIVDKESKKIFFIFRQNADLKICQKRLFSQLDSHFVQEICSYFECFIWRIPISFETHSGGINGTGEKKGGEENECCY